MREYLFSLVTDESLHAIVKDTLKDLLVVTVTEELLLQFNK